MRFSAITMMKRGERFSTKEWYDRCDAYGISVFLSAAYASKRSFQNVCYDKKHPRPCENSKSFKMIGIELHILSTEENIT